MFDFFKKNIFYITILFVILEFCSCLLNGIRSTDFFLFLISMLFSIIIFFLNCKVLKKGHISDRDIFVLFGILFLTIIFYIISFIQRDNEFTFLSIISGIFFMTEFILIRIFDITCI